MGKVIFFIAGVLAAVVIGVSAGSMPVHAAGTSTTQEINMTVESGAVTDIVIPGVPNTSVLGIFGSGAASNIAFTVLMITGFTLVALVIFKFRHSPRKRTVGSVAAVGFIALASVALFHKPQETDAYATEPIISLSQAAISKGMLQGQSIDIDFNATVTSGYNSLAYRISASPDRTVDGISLSLNDDYLGNKTDISLATIDSPVLIYALDGNAKDGNITNHTLSIDLAEDLPDGIYTFIITYIVDVDEPEAFVFTINTRMTDTLDTDPTHYDGTATAFQIPVSGLAGGVGSAPGSNIPYDWVIDWGDGSPQENVSGVSVASGNGIAHDYAVPGEYQITIMSNGYATSGWLNAFGFSLFSPTGASAPDNKNMFKSLDSPFTNLMRDGTYRYAYMFFQVRNAVGIPAGLFSLLDTSEDTDFYGMFTGTFDSFAINSTTATIPAGLFDSIDVSNADGLSSMFTLTFALYGTNSTVADIPAGLFDTIRTANVSDMQGLYEGTFTYYAANSPNASIPNNLFTGLDTSSATGVSYMFMQTFYNFAAANTTPTTDINDIWGDAYFANVTATNVGGSNGMFYNTFNGMPSLTGSAQDFIINRLGGINPVNTTQTFTGTSVTDLTAIDINWR